MPVVYYTTRAKAHCAMDTKHSDVVSKSLLHVIYLENAIKLIKLCCSPIQLHVLSLNKVSDLSAIRIYGKKVGNFI